MAASRFFGTAAFLARGLEHLLFPPTCAVCAERLDRATDLLCPDCEAGLEEVGAGEVLHQLARLPIQPCPIDDAFALWYFEHDGAVQRIHHQLKYGNRPILGSLLGRRVAAGLLRNGRAHGLQVVVPVPLHRRRYLERGYNQSAMLGEGIAESLGLDFLAEVLVRTRSTRTQTHLPRPARWSNVSGAFAVTRPESVRGRRVLLIDDVITTGSTATAAAGVLKQSGATGVILAALAFARS